MNYYAHPSNKYNPLRFAFNRRIESLFIDRDVEVATDR